MTNKEQKLEQIKRDPTKEVQKIDLGWRGYVPGYKDRVTKQINTQIKDQFDGSVTQIDKLPGGSIERPVGSQQLPDSTNPQSIEPQTAPLFDKTFTATPETISEEAILQETDYANQLAQEQQEDWEQAQIREEVNMLYEEGKDTSLHPFVWNYIIFLFPLAILNDGVDLLNLIPVIGWVLSWFAYFFLSIILIFSQFFFNSSYQKAKKYLNGLEAKLKNIDQKLLLLTRSTRYGLAAAKTLRRIPGMQGVARKIPRILVKLRKPIKPLLRNPTIKLVLGAGLEAIPILSWAPWSTLSVFIAYLDERKIHKDARKAAEEVRQSYSETLTSEA